MSSNCLISAFVFTSLCHVLLAGVLPDQQDGAGKKDTGEHLSMGRRPSHLEAIPLERNGALNKEFRREVLLGEDTDSMKDEKSKKQEHPGQDSSKELTEINEKIREMLKSADLDGDGKLSTKELLYQILKNTHHHLEEGRKEAEETFQIVDGNGDGKITWEEYKTHLLQEKTKVTDETSEKHIPPLDKDVEEALKEDKTTFERADADNDGLDETEWLGFRHPEHSKVMMKEWVDELLKSFDTNNDGKLSVDEFTVISPGEAQDSKMVAEYRETRRHEFNTLIDKDHDGYATVEELKEFADPRNEQHSKDEVHEIFTLTDFNQDGLLTLDELLSRADLMAASGFIHARERLHDDL